MTRSELSDRLSRRFSHLPPKAVDAAVRTLLDLMSETMASRERIEIRHFGSFFCHTYKPHIGRNPKTGDPVEVKAKAIARFRPARTLIARLNGEMDHPTGT